MTDRAERDSDRAATDQEDAERDDRDAERDDRDAERDDRDAEPSVGLERGTVALREHDARWGRAFEREADRLRDALGDRVLAVEHVGSTAVEGLPAKPIVDVAVAVDSLATARESVPALEAMGYERRPGATGDRVMLAKGPRERRTYHTSLVVHGSREWRAYLAFRDALRGDDALREEYAALKRALAAAHSADRATYTERKAAFVERVIEDAIDEALAERGDASGDRR